MYQHRGVLRTPLNIQDVDFCKEPFLLKTPSQKSDWFSNTCYKIVVRKFSMYKLKQKKAENVKN